MVSEEKMKMWKFNDGWRWRQRTQSDDNSWPGPGELKNILPPAHQRGGGSRMLSRKNIMSEIKVAVAKINFIKLFHVLKLLKSSQALV